MDEKHGGMIVAIDDDAVNHQGPIRDSISIKPSSRSGECPCVDVDEGGALGGFDLLGR